MGDAELRRLEHEDRVAVVAGAVEVAHVGRHVAHMHVLVRQVVDDRAGLVAPALQRVGDAGLDAHAVMRRVRVVHRHDVGRQRRAHIVVVVGDDLHAAGGLDQEAGMADIGDADLAGRHGADAEGGGPERRPVRRDMLETGGLCDGAEADQRQHGSKKGERGAAVHGRAPCRRLASLCVSGTNGPAGFVRAAIHPAVETARAMYKNEHSRVGMFYRIRRGINQHLNGSAA